MTFRAYEHGFPRVPCGCGCGQLTSDGIGRSGTGARFIQGHGLRGRVPNRPLLPIDARFWAKVDKSGGPDACWPFLGQRNKGGHGRFWINGAAGSNAGKLAIASRVAWELANGPIPDGLHALHKCDNPPCCNPAHLFLGTIADNTADMVAKDRHCVGERSGRAILSREQVIEIRRMKAAGAKLGEIRAKFGLSRSTADAVVRGVTYPNVGGRRCGERGMVSR